MIPNKLIRYEESIIPKSFSVINQLRVNSNISVMELYKKVQKNVKNINNFLEILCFLYAIGYVRYENGRVTLC